MSSVAGDPRYSDEEVRKMSKTIRDLFTNEEWEIFAVKIVPRLQQIGDLSLPEELETEVPASDDT